MVKHTSIQAMSGLVASWDLHIQKIDVKTVFLHGDLEEEQYMEKPKSFFFKSGEEHLVCRFKKSLFGLKQTPRQ